MIFLFLLVCYVILSLMWTGRIRVFYLDKIENTLVDKILSYPTKLLEKLIS
jgi:hypothetical protein